MNSKVKKKKIPWIKGTLKILGYSFISAVLISGGFYFGFNAGYDTCLYLCLEYIESLGVSF